MAFRSSFRRNLLTDGSTILLVPANPASLAVSDFLAVVIPAFILIYAMPYWKAALKAAAIVAIVTLPFTPVWDSFWTLATKDWLSRHSGVTTVLRGERQPIPNLISDVVPD